MEMDQRIFLVTQKSLSVNEPKEDDLYAVGTVSRVKQVLRLNASTVRVMVEGECRAQLRRLWQATPYLQGNVEEICENIPSEAFRNSPRTEALLRQTVTLFGEYAELIPNLPDEVLATVMDNRDAGYLADYLAQNINLRMEEKQAILAEVDPFARLRRMNKILARETDVLSFEREMEGKVRGQLEQGHKEHILRTQIRVLQSELGEDDDDELETYRQKILELKLPEDTEKRLLKEVNRLAKQPFSSAEAAVIRNYLDVCLEMPWNNYSKELLNIQTARKVLEHDHFGLEKV